MLERCADELARLRITIVDLDEWTVAELRCPPLPSTSSWSWPSPKTPLRYRLLHAAGRIVRRARHVVLRLPANWPSAVELAEAYRRVSLVGT